MTVSLPIVVGHIPSYHADYWIKFIDDTYEWSQRSGDGATGNYAVANRLEQEYNARIDYEADNILFDLASDRTMFILRWA